MPRGRLLAITVATAALVGVGVAEATDSSSPTRADKARATGISVDPDAAAQMDAAPEGSCYADPTQAKCPQVKAMRVAHLSGGPSVIYSTAP